MVYLHLSTDVWAVNLALLANSSSDAETYLCLSLMVGVWTVAVGSGIIWSTKRRLYNNATKHIVYTISLIAIHLYYLFCYLKDFWYVHAHTHTYIFFCTANKLRSIRAS